MFTAYAGLPTGSAELSKRSSGIERLPLGAPGRAELEAFIAASFRARYSAELSHFSKVLLGVRDDRGRWIAALGYTPAASGRLFLEHYLDTPVETAIAARVRGPVSRTSVVEVGNLAAAHPGAVRALIVSTPQLLHGLGMRWVVFTATTSLLNSFSRLRLQPELLANADASRLPDGGRHWGSYYETQPKVMFGDIHHGFAQRS